MNELETLHALLDKLKLNMTVKRHSSGKFDGRIYHPWIHNPILSATGKDSYQQCVDEFCRRVHAIERMRDVIERKNAKREKLYADEKGKAIWDAEEHYSTWNEWI